MRPDLLLMGEAFDELIFSHLSDFSRAGNPLKANHFKRAPRGRVIITAVTAARLGLDPCVLSALSPLAREALLREGIAYRNLLRPGEEPALAVSLRTDKERTAVTYLGINELLEDRMTESLVRSKVWARHVHGAFFPRDCRKWLEPLAMLREKKLGLSWDFGWNPDLSDEQAFLELVGLLDVVFLTEAGAMHYSGEKTLEEALAFWGEHAAHTVIRGGAEGCCWVGREGKGPSAGVVGVNGETIEAVDAFNGGFLCAWISGGGLDESMKLATRVSALSSKRGEGLDGIPYREELE